MKIARVLTLIAAVAVAPSVFAAGAKKPAAKKADKKPTPEYCYEMVDGKEAVNCGPTSKAECDASKGKWQTCKKPEDMKMCAGNTGAP
jgi:hypothetical protein